MTLKKLIEIAEKSGIPINNFLKLYEYRKLRSVNSSTILSKAKKNYEKALLESEVWQKAMNEWVEVSNSFDFSKAENLSEAKENFENTPHIPEIEKKAIDVWIKLLKSNKPTSFSEAKENWSNTYKNTKARKVARDIWVEFLKYNNPTSISEARDNLRDAPEESEVWEEALRQIVELCK